MVQLLIVFALTALVAVAVIAVIERRPVKDASVSAKLMRYRVSGVVHEPSEMRRLAELQKRIRARAQERIVADEQTGAAA